jgi:hypothetical protein
MIIPIYQVEIPHRRIRGKTTSLQQPFNALGQIFATWIGHGCYTTWKGTGNTREWRISLVIQIIPAILLGSLVYLFPESPRWLCDHDMSEKRLKNLAPLHSHGEIDYLCLGRAQSYSSPDCGTTSSTDKDILLRDGPNFAERFL